MVPFAVEFYLRGFERRKLLSDQRRKVAAQRFDFFLLVVEIAHANNLLLLVFVFKRIESAKKNY